MTSAIPHDDIVFMSAEATAAAIRSGEFTATDAVNAYLRRIDAIDGEIKAYITVSREEALGAASDVDDALRRGDDSVNGALFGVPVGIKDQFNTAGILTSNGSRAYSDNVPATDATVVSRMKDAGAILLGKLNLSELAMGGTADPPYGTPQNPWRRDHTPGESSSGSGAALAAHLLAASVGEDTGGSGRGPASYCNAVGLRPTFTRISRHGITPMCWFMDAASPMTKTVEDCALVLGAIAGYDSLDPTTSRRPVPDYRAMLDGDVRGMRVGRLAELCDSPDMHTEVRQAIDDALETLAGLGAEVVNVSVPLTEIAGAIFVGIADTEGAGARDGLMRRAPEQLDRASRTRLQSASLVPAKVQNRAMKARVLLRQQFEEAFRNVDVLVSPTAPYPAPRHDALTAPFESAEDVRQRFFFRRSYTGCYPLAAMPAVSIPGGFTEDGLPIGLQIGAGPFAEGTILRAAYAYQQATDWHTRRAPV
jgi:aspartyl-tRNA(Asn)/glutamyl-tRNA(Gln) amidotransferase subunit A